MRTKPADTITFMRSLTAKILFAITAGALISACGPATTPSPTSAPAATNPAAGAVAALNALPVTAEPRRSGYDRDLFDHWVDANDNGCDTRCEVLARDLDPTLGSSGGWRSAYDGVTRLNPSEIQIDHVVALAEAWDSGAASWPEDRRRAFANDLTERRALIAVTGESNQAKSDLDPADWLPRNEDRCRYADAWVAVKTRWALSIDRDEKAALASILNSCGTTVAWVPPAAGTLAMTPTTSTAFANCAEARAAGAAPVRLGDPGYGPHLDGDGDGIACE